MRRSGKIFNVFALSTFFLSLAVFCADSVQADISGPDSVLHAPVISSPGLQNATPEMKARIDVSKALRFPHREGEVLVKFKKGVSTDYAMDIANSHSMSIKTRFHVLSRDINQGFMLMKSSENTAEMISRLKNDPNVEAVSPNYRRQLTKIPNDPFFDELWGLYNNGQQVEGSTGLPGIDISAMDAWEVNTGSKDVIVADLDTGVDYTHEDLQPNIWVNPREIPNDGIDNDGNGYVDDVYGYDFAGNNEGDNDPDPMDIHGHGTHTSGTIAAAGNNGIGITGVNWRAKIMVLKGFRPDMGLYDSDAIEAIEYAIMMKKEYGYNIVAINASWGGGGNDDLLKEAIEKAGQAGIIFCAAAGNDGTDNDSDPQYPCCYDLPNIISVAAVDQEGYLASWSNYGTWSTHIAAPGVNILSTLPGNNYDYWDGTSMATPHVTGAIALIASRFPGENALEWKARLYVSARPISDLDMRVATGGMVDLYSALTTGNRPAIFSISPRKVQEGQSLTITGYGFGNSGDAGIVVFPPDMEAEIISWENEKIQCNIPEGMENGKLYVEVNGLGRSNGLYVELEQSGMSPIWSGFPGLGFFSPPGAGGGTPVPPGRRR